MTKLNVPDRVLNEIVAFAERHAVERVVLFGSRARGSHTRRSDVDLAVQGGDFDAFYWDVKEKTHSLLSFDVVDLDREASEELKREIEREGITVYEKARNFSRSLNVLKGADFEFANENEIYRTGVVGQFNLTFELAWKALQQALREHGAESADSGSPREILQLGYKFGFVDDSAVWLAMLKKRNSSAHIYNEDEIDETVLMIRDSFIPAFVLLERTLKQKLGGDGGPDGGTPDSRSRAELR